MFWLTGSFRRLRTSRDSEQGEPDFQYRPDALKAGGFVALLHCLFLFTPPLPSSTASAGWLPQSVDQGLHE